MKQYLRNLWLSFIGCNPYADEVNNLHKELEKEGEKVQRLQEQLYAALNKWNECQSQLDDIMKHSEDATKASVIKQLKSMQRLVENLRERIKEKDGKLEQQDRIFQELMEQMKSDYHQRLKEYNDRLGSI